MKWVKEVITDRNSKIKEEHNLMIKLDPAIAAAFTDSTFVSRKYFDFTSSIFITLTLKFPTYRKQGCWCQPPQDRSQEEEN
jgi:hypothetical protein